MTHSPANNNHLHPHALPIHPQDHTHNTHVHAPTHNPVGETLLQGEHPHTQQNTAMEIEQAPENTQNLQENKDTHLERKENEDQPGSQAAEMSAGSIREGQHSEEDRGAENKGKKLIQESDGVRVQGGKRRRPAGGFIRQEDQEAGRKKRMNEEVSCHKSGAPSSYKSKRKIKPQQPSVLFGNSNPEERLGSLESLFRECHSSSVAKKYQKKSSSSVAIQTSTWLHREFFYSNFEKPYYQQSDFKELLETMGWKPSDKLPFSDFKKIQKAMGRVKLFSSSFVQEERLGLEDTRELARSYCRTQNMNVLTERLENTTSIPYFERVIPLKVGSSVLAVANCGHLHLGSIFGEHRENLLVVKFYNLELGIQKIHDHSISSQYLLCKKAEHRQSQVSESFTQNKTNELIENVDFLAVALFFKSLIIKGAVLNSLSQLNIETTRLRDEGQEINEQRKEDYRRVTSLLGLLNTYIKLISNAFRLRGVSAYRKEQLSKSINKLLTNPLNFMEKQLEAHFEEVDQGAIKQINQILLSQQQVKVQQLTRSLLCSLGCQGEVFSSEEGKLVRNCLSILISMKMESRPFALIENKYMKNISGIIYHFGEQLGQINSCITSICSK